MKPRAFGEVNHSINSAKCAMSKRICVARGRMEKGSRSVGRKFMADLTSQLGCEKNTVRVLKLVYTGRAGGRRAASRSSDFN